MFMSYFYIISNKIPILSLTGHPHSKDRASAAGKPLTAIPSLYVSLLFHVQSCPAGKQILPKYIAGHPWDPLLGQDPSI